MIAVEGKISGKHLTGSLKQTYIQHSDGATCTTGPMTFST